MTAGGTGAIPVQDYIVARQPVAAAARSVYRFSAGPYLQALAACLSSSTLLSSSHVNSASSLPKCPPSAVLR